MIHPMLVVGNIPEKWTEFRILVQLLVDSIGLSIVHSTPLRSLKYFVKMNELERVRPTLQFWFD